MKQMMKQKDRLLNNMLIYFYSVMTQVEELESGVA